MTATADVPTRNVRGGLGFWGALLIVFVALKFGGVIAWPWWLVILFPLLAPVALALIWAALLVALALVVGAVREATIRRTAKKFSTRAGAR